MSWWDEAEESLGLGNDDAPAETPQVVRADPAAAQSAWETASSWVGQQASAAEEKASSAWDGAASAASSAEQSAGEAWDDAAATAAGAEQAAGEAWDDAASTVDDTAAQAWDEASAGVGAAEDTAAQAWDDAATAAEQTADERTVDPRQVVRADPREAQTGWDTATDWARSEASDAERAASAGWDAVLDEGNAAGDAELAAIGDAANQASDLASQFASNAETQFRNDPVDFVNTALGGTHLDYDDDASDGKMALHVRNPYAQIDAQWQDGKGATLHEQAGADWGRAPYLAVDMATDDKGEITKLTGTEKVTIPLEALDVKSEMTGGYQKTADGYSASFSQSAGVSVDGIEVMEGVHGAVQDHGDRGYSVSGGPHVSVGTGAGGHDSGFDPVEVGIKASPDITYSDMDGQTTVGVQDTTSAEVKIIGQTVLQGQNTVGAQYSDGPQGEHVTVYDTASGTAGNQKFGGSVTGSEGARYTYGTDAQGNEVSQLTTTEQSSTTDMQGNQTQIVNDSTTYDVPTPDIDTPSVLPDPAALRNDVSMPTNPDAGDGGIDVDQPMILTNPDMGGGGIDVDQPMILTNPDMGGGGIDVDQPMILTNPDMGGGGIDVDQPMILTNPDIGATDAMADALGDGWSDPGPTTDGPVVLPENWGGMPASQTTIDLGDVETWTPVSDEAVGIADLPLDTMSDQPVDDAPAADTYASFDADAYATPVETYDTADVESYDTADAVDDSYGG